MKKFLIAIIVLFSMSSVASATFVLVDQTGNRINVKAEVIVPGWGTFFTDPDGTQEVSQWFDENTQATGRTLPEELTMFVVPNGSYGTALATVSTNELRDGVVKFAVPDIVTYSPEYVARTIEGPVVVDGAGRSPCCVRWWVVGSGMQGHAVGGTIRGSLYLPKDRHEVTVAVHLPLYELSLVEVTLPEYGGGKEGKFPLRQEPIVLQPAINPVSRVTVRNDGIKLVEGTIFETSYWKAIDGSYGYVVECIDPEGVITTCAYIDLDHIRQTVGLLPEVGALQLPKGEPVVVSDLPPSFPRIILDTDKVRFTSADAKPAPIQAFDDGKVTEGFVLTALRWVIGLLLIGAFLSGIVVGIFRLNEYAEFRLRKEFNEFMRRLQAIGFVVRQSVFTSYDDLVKEKTVDNNTKTLLRSIRGTLENLVAEHFRISEVEDELADKLNAHLSLQTEYRKHAQQCFDRQSYDLALSLKAAVEESERQASVIGESFDAVTEAMKERAQACHEVYRVLEDTVERALLSQRHTILAGEADELNDVIEKVLSNIKKHFDESVVHGNDAEVIRQQSQERKKSQRVGIDANQLADLQEFLDQAK
jgi:hypothetical protein